MDASDWLSVAALLIAVLVGFFQAMLQRRELDLQGRIEALERERREEEVAKSKRADVVARFENRESLGTALVIENRGPATARRVDFSIKHANTPAADPPLDSRHVLVDDGELPVPVLDVGTKYPVPFAVYLNGPVRYHVSLSWEDDGGDREKVVFLRL